MKKNDAHLKLKNRVALVTGSSQGIGLAIALALGREGSKIALCSRNKGNIQKASTLLKKNHVEHLPYIGNAMSKDFPQKIIGKIIKKWGQLEILVNNVGGIAKIGTFFELQVKDWIHAFYLNVLSTVRMCRAAVPYLKKSSSPRIIN